MALRRALAALIDAAAAALLAYLGFRLAVPLSGCRDLSSCPQLAPLIVVVAIVLIGLYFFSALALWHQSPGQRLLAVSGEDGTSDDL